MDVAFIGLGNMGIEMAKNLMEAGHRLAVYNRTRSRAEPVQAAGAKVAATPGAAAAMGGTVITMLADDHAVEEIMFEPGNVLDAMLPGSVHISMSTISVDLSRRLTEAHRARGQHFIAAPVFGRPDAAAAARLFIVAAGPADAIEQCRPLFDAMGQQTFIMSDHPPAANVVKLTGNFLITTVIESLAEAVALVRKFGMDDQAFLDFLTTSLFTAPIYRTYGDMVTGERFEPAGFRLPLGFKDNRLLMAAAEEAAVPIPMASLIHDRFVAALAQGLEDSDWSAIARISYQNAGLAEVAT